MVKKIIFLLLIILIFATTILLQNRVTDPNNDIDNLEKSLAPIREIIPLDARIKFYSNFTNDKIIYFQSQFILCPTILDRNTNAQCDTLLCIIDPDCDIVSDFQDYDTITHTYYKKYDVFLMNQQKH